MTWYKSLEIKEQGICIDRTIDILRESDLKFWQWNFDFICDSFWLFQRNFFISKALFCQFFISETLFCQFWIFIFFCKFSVFKCVRSHVAIYEVSQTCFEPYVNIMPKRTFLTNQE